MEPNQKVTIHYTRVGGEVSHYIEGLVADDGVRLVTFSIIPQEFTTGWSMRWQQAGLIPAGRTLKSVRKYLFYRQYFTILEYRDTADQLLGYYCDVTAPLQKADDGYHLQDLVLDLWVTADGQTLELDWDEFEGALRAGLIPDDLGEKAAVTLKWMATEARTGRFPSAFIG
jgi:hypothetical protein